VLKTFLVALPFIVLATSAPSKETAGPRWQVLADCAAAYQANSEIADPNRLPSMRAMIADQGKDYQKAAVQEYRARAKGEGTTVDKTVNAYVNGATSRFAKEPRPVLEKIIDACPQLDN